MTLNKKVVRVPETFYDTDLKSGKANKKPMRGRVCYIHPAGRYHTVEFQTRGGVIRESFQGVAD